MYSCTRGGNRRACICLHACIFADIINMCNTRQELSSNVYVSAQPHRCVDAPTQHTCISIDVYIFELVCSSVSVSVSAFGNLSKLIAISIFSPIRSYTPEIKFVRPTLLGVSMFTFVVIFMAPFAWSSDSSSHTPCHLKTHIRSHVGITLHSYHTIIHGQHS